jgi:hypothetical protein
MAELAQVQSWLQRAVFAGGAEPAFADAIVAGDERLDAAGRVAVYARGYRARLIDCLRGEYPALRRFAGDTAFGLFAAGYIAERPSTDRSLYAFGAGFAGYLAAHKPKAEPGSLLAVPAELAALERARGEAQRAAGIEGRFAPVGADYALVPGARLRLPGPVRLLRLGFDLLPLVEAFDRGEPLPVPAAAESLVAVARSGYRVRLHRLAPWQFAWLEALGREGCDVQQAAGEAARGCGGDSGRILAALTRWLPSAGQAGLVTPA